MPKGPQGQKRPGLLWRILLVPASLVAMLAAALLIDGRIPNGFVIFGPVYVISLVALIWRRHAKGS